jgi:hypothetical protein
MQYATKHIWQTVDGRYVPTGHLDAAVLAAAPGDEEPVDFKGFADDEGPFEVPEKRQVRRKAAAPSAE